MSWSLLGSNALAVLALMSFVWVVSVYLRDASVVDPWWSMAFLLVTGATVARTGMTPSKVLLLVLVATWAIRLWLHLLVRSRGKPEDPRYTAFRRRFGPERYWWVSFFQVFMLQGALVVVISAPLQMAASAPPPDGLTVAGIVGAAVFAIGFAWETVADAQLAAFRRASAARREVLDTGLWRFTRHPNYFGEALLWWGFWISSLAQPFGWATVFAPILMTFLLVKVSGVSMLDEHLRKTKPGFEAYMARTSAFFPRLPRDTEGRSG